MALSNQTGYADFYISEGASDGSSSLLKPKAHLKYHPDVHFRHTISIKTITLDDWALENNAHHIDFLWLDLQGAELRVLKTATSILSTVKAIHAEISLVETYEGVESYDELSRWLFKHGFRVEKEQLPWPDMGNVLFVRE